MRSWPRLVWLTTVSVKDKATQQSLTIWSHPFLAPVPKHTDESVNEEGEGKEGCCKSPVSAQGKQEEQKSTKGYQNAGEDKQQDLQSLRKSPETTWASSLFTYHSCE